MTRRHNIHRVLALSLALTALTGAQAAASPYPGGGAAREPVAVSRPAAAAPRAGFPVGGTAGVISATRSATTAPTVRATTGFHWGDAGVGAALMLVLGIGAGGLATIGARRSNRHPAAVRVTGA